MIGRLRTGAKFFTVGLILGLLFAPDSGALMRARLRARALRYMPGALRDE
jgi:hypothetical protein